MAEGTRPVTAGSEGAAEHAVLTEHATLAKHALVRSLIRNVGREGAAEHAGLR
jgi:hypothetical protein